MRDISLSQKVAYAETEKKGTGYFLDNKETLYICKDRKQSA
jgi:hypothetical protein